MPKSPKFLHDQYFKYNNKTISLLKTNSHNTTGNCFKEVIDTDRPVGIYICAMSYCNGFFCLCANRQLTEPPIGDARRRPVVIYWYCSGYPNNNFFLSKMSTNLWKRVQFMEATLLLASIRLKITISFYHFFACTCGKFI